MGETTLAMGLHSGLTPRKKLKSQDDPIRIPTSAELLARKKTELAQLRAEEALHVLTQGALLESVREAQRISLTRGRRARGG